MVITSSKVVSNTPHEFPNCIFSLHDPPKQSIMKSCGMLSIVLMPYSKLFNASRSLVLEKIGTAVARGAHAQALAVLYLAHTRG